MNLTSTTPMRAGKKRLGVIGTFVWDVIHGRDGRSVPVEEWGGITYTLAGLDAALSNEWEIVPIMKVGDDLAEKARIFCKSLRRMAPDAELIGVPHPNQRVTLRYTDAERRTEVLTGGVPAWTWTALKPVLDDAKLDALLVNFLSGWELDLPTMQMLRGHLDIPIYCDLHMLMWAVQSDGRRTLRVLPDVAQWCACFDVLQMNEDEMAMLAPDPLALAATAMAAGTSCLCITLGSQGVVYVAAPGFERLSDRPERNRISTGSRGGAGGFGAVRTALVPATIAQVDGDGDPTGCGDVWGATHFSRLLAGDMLSEAILAANKAAARNVEHRGATGLAQHLRGELSTT
ncbi:MAG: PfkB family carbohydrate kinase [Gemmatimonadaceae bacterium]